MCRKVSSERNLPPGGPIRLSLAPSTLSHHVDSGEIMMPATSAEAFASSHCVSLVATTGLSCLIFKTVIQFRNRA